MNLYELNTLITQLEKSDDFEMLEFYCKMRDELKKDIQKEIRQILDL